MTKKRILAVVLAALVFFVMFSSSLYIIGHADHDCTGEDCPVCQQIFHCTQTLKTLSLAVMGASVFFSLAALLHITVRQSVPVCVPHTPVFLKVKLTD